MIVDRTSEIEAEQAAQENARRFNIASKATSDAIGDWDLLTGR